MKIRREPGRPRAKRGPPALETARAKNREWNSRNYLVQKKKLNDYKLSCGCNQCGYAKSAAALDLHHHNTNTKKFACSLANIGRRGFWEEVAKCSVLCANCHREIHEKINEKYH